MIVVVAIEQVDVGSEGCKVAAQRRTLPLQELSADRLVPELGAILFVLRSKVTDGQEDI
jgi:hypothetical protein